MQKLKDIYCKNLNIIIFCALLSSSVFSVQAKTEDSKQTIQGDKQAPQIPTDTEKEEKKYIYDPTGKTDPFKSFIVVREEKAEKDKGKPKTYLETLELSQLSLSVIIIGKTNRWAMVTDSKGDGHVIKVGTPIGTNGGVVYKIEPGEVIIKEEVTNFKGEKEPRLIEKKAPSDR